jgi:hypothetical protein
VLLDHSVGQLRLIFQPILSDGQCLGSEPHSSYLVYAQRLDCTRSDPSSGLFRLKRASSANPSAPFQRLGAVVELSQIRCAVHVAPYFGQVANQSFSEKNYTEISKYYNLNKYSDKETFELLYEVTD